MKSPSHDPILMRPLENVTHGTLQAYSTLANKGSSFALSCNGVPLKAKRFHQLNSIVSYRFILQEMLNID
jgi:hypothetical protein